MLTKMMFLTVMFFAQACGDTTKLAESIDKASEASKQKDEDKDKDESEADVDVSEDGTTVITTVSVTTTVSIDGESSESEENQNPLKGTWLSQCDDGIRVSLSFGDKVVTKITSVYDDVVECSGMPQTATQRIGYEIVGDNGVSFGKADVGEFTIDGDYLTLAADPSYEYRRK